MHASRVYFCAVKGDGDGTRMNPEDDGGRLSTTRVVMDAPLPVSPAVVNNQPIVNSAGRGAEAQVPRPAAAVNPGSYASVCFRQLLLLAICYTALLG